MKKKTATADFNRSRAIREALKDLKNPNASTADVAEWIGKKYPKQKKAIDDLGDKLSSYIAGQRQTVGDELGIEVTGGRKRKTAAKKTSGGMSTADIQRIAELIDSQFDGDPDKLLSVVNLVNQYDANQLKDAVETWGEMVAAAKGDTGLARKMLEIMGKAI